MSRHPGEAPRDASSHLSPEAAIETFLQRLPDRCHLLVAFSGGGDSSGLLAALSAARRQHPGLTLHAATVDHGLRAGSAEEAEAASRLSRKLGVPHAILRWTGEKPSTGIQAAARAARYSLLVAEARRVGAELIVTGHTFDDQLETIAMRRLRNPIAEYGMDEAVLIARNVWAVRPFLAVRRQAIRNSLLKRRLSWSEDPSNDNPAFERVRVRRNGLSDDLPMKAPDRGASMVAAQFVTEHVRLHPGPVISVDLSDCYVRHAPHWSVLATLIAIAGGQTYGPDANLSCRIVDRVAEGGDFRLTAGGVLLDRRKHMLFLCREERGLAPATIPPGQGAYWDGRYHILNRGSEPATVTAGAAWLTAAPLLPSPENAGLPKGVARLAASSTPRVVEGDAATLDVRMVLAPFEDFLPHSRFQLADSIVIAFGLEHFPGLLLGISPFGR